MTLLQWQGSTLLAGILTSLAAWSLEVDRREDHGRWSSGIAEFKPGDRVAFVQTQKDVLPGMRLVYDPYDCALPFISFRLPLKAPSPSDRQWTRQLVLRVDRELEIPADGELRVRAGASEVWATADAGEATPTLLARMSAGQSISMRIKGTDPAPNMPVVPLPGFSIASKRASSLCSNLSNGRRR